MWPPTSRTLARFWWSKRPPRGSRPHWPRVGRPTTSRPWRRPKKVQGNTQRALDQALNVAAKRGEEVETVRGALGGAEEGRRKAEVEAAALRVEVEAQRRRGDDLQQRLGVAEAQVRSLTSTLSASFTAE